MLPPCLSFGMPLVTTYCTPAAVQHQSRHLYIQSLEVALLLYVGAYKHTPVFRYRPCHLCMQSLVLSLPLLPSSVACSQGLSMVSTPTPPPPVPTDATASVPLSQDQFNAYVQSTYGRYPLTIVGGEGCKLFDSDGKVRRPVAGHNCSLQCLCENCAAVCVQSWLHLNLLQSSYFQLITCFEHYAQNMCFFSCREPRDRSPPSGALVSLHRPHSRLTLVISNCIRTRRAGIP